MSRGSTSGLTQGSVWRRWDPHVHLPGTLLNNQFGSTTIEQALDAIAARTPSIEVVGVTDYFSTRTFRAAEGAWMLGSAPSIKYLFPNVELRLNDATAAGKGVNLHVQAAADDVDTLDTLLSRLHFNFQDVDYSASDADLIKLGRAYKNNSSLAVDAARSEGANQFKVNFKDLKELFQGNTTFREKCLVGVAAGKDGASGMKAEDGGFVAYRQGLERFAHVIFSGSEKDREFWLGHGVDDERVLEKKYGGLKLCLHGSDAHDLAKLGKPDQDRFCWLKGDPTFDTLWQACLAPERRASVSAASPGAGQHGRINGVSIPDTSWFTPGAVPINTGLVAVIGPRGSGKTALADLVAVGAGSAQPFDNERSFVARAGGLIAKQSATVSWHDDSPTTYSLSAPATGSEGSPRRVRYLSQQFVERLCASDGVTNELLFEIERVIFQAWPIEQRQGATSFRDLLDIRLGATRASQRDELDAITSLSEEITNQRVLQRGLKNKKEQRSTVTANITTLEGQIKELTGKADSASGERHAEVSRALAKRQTELQTVDRKRTDLKKLKAAAETSRGAQFPTFQQRLQSEHPYAGLTPDQWKDFLPKFSGDVDNTVAEALTSAALAYTSIAGTPLPDGNTANLDGVSEEDLESRTVAELIFEQARLQNLVGLDTKRATALTQLQNQLTKARSAGDKLDLDIAAAEGAEAKALELAGERNSRYKAYFNALLAEETELKALYAPLEKLLGQFGPSVAKLKLSVRRRVNLDAWVGLAEKQLIDLRTAGPFRGTGGLRPIAQSSLLTAWESGDAETASAAIQEFSQQHSSALREQAPADTKADEAAYREWERAIARWLYGVGHINVVYSLEYDGLNVERLSPGSRGIVLLLLYLAVDQSETDPLIIDQPEENLDPKSVYTELVKLFQSASDRRQIIMVTHNANLVVNTDVDQVIVASCESLEEGKLPKLSYQAGGLENPAIRSAVCEVLEGGAEAFQQRARRLHIDAPSTRPI
jgi:replicative DNA helicase